MYAMILPVKNTLYKYKEEFTALAKSKTLRHSECLHSLISLNSLNIPKPPQ